MNNREIEKWITRNGTHIPVYKKDIFSTVDELEKRASKLDLSEATIDRLYKQSQKALQELKIQKNKAHPLDDMDKFKASQQRLEKLLKKLRNNYDNDNSQW